jgi:hypothetical protein
LVCPFERGSWVGTATRGIGPVGASSADGRASGRTRIRSRMYPSSEKGREVSVTVVPVADGVFAHRRDTRDPEA